MNYHTNSEDVLDAPQNSLKSTSFSMNHKDNSSKIFNVMIVDDIEINLYLLGEIIGSLNSKLNIIKCISGMESIEKFKLQKPDILLLDIHMPSLNGFETAKIIRNLEMKMNLPPTPIVALTADNLIENVIDDQSKLLFNDFITKPIDFSKLSKCFNNYLSNTYD
jgi:CheY-like chemotaxis protein